ncbi:WD40 repeat-like protein [Phanerochaete sordida]|uniref:WD40 repeat-like protein n=1 Tax=Phanerochaete sordida TaxID=48140 RepID=A0A9P3L9W2_9APHY|nr:WD40 repeat-like protein [Phanerochaete sordida]
MQTTDKNNFLRAEAELIIDDARKAKAEKIKDIGEPIQLTGVALDLHIRDKYAWIAENSAVIRRVDLESGKTVQLFKGHTAPVTAIALWDKVSSSGDEKLMISASWDKTIKIWNRETKELLSSTDAHSDFVKALLVIPSLQLLVSSSSDKIVRFWDLSAFAVGQPLHSAGSISAHTRPVESLSYRPISNATAVLYTADTMGIIRVWELEKEEGTPTRWRAVQKDELTYHRTKIYEAVYGAGQLWTASADETAQAKHDPEPDATPAPRPMPPLTHPTGVRAILPLLATPLAEPYVLTGAGDVIRAYDVSSPDAPELLGERDAHWHDVTALRLWMRRSAVEGAPGKVRVEPWVVSASLDGTLRKWKLMDLLHPPKPVEKAKEVAPPPPKEVEEKESFGLTEDEERELAELMEDD